MSAAFKDSVSQTRKITLLATVLLVPWELLVAFGLTFSFRKHEPPFAWAFVFFTAILNLPAILSSWRFPRFAAYWVATNTLFSILIAAGAALRSYAELRRNHQNPMLTDFSVSGLAAGIVKESLVLWLPQVLFVVLLLLSSRVGSASSLASDSRL